jgi:hypothetical protein
MDAKRIGFTLSIALFLACLLYMVSTYENLPTRVAVQFDFNNKPTSWQSKSGFIKLYLSVLVGLNIFLGFLTNLLTRIPHSLINVPWRKYWFSTEEKKSIGLRQNANSLGLRVSFCKLDVSLHISHCLSGKQL